MRANNIHMKFIFVKLSFIYWMANYCVYTFSKRQLFNGNMNNQALNICELLEQSMI